MNHLKTLTMVSMETNMVSGDSILYKVSENLYLNGFWEEEQCFLLGGGGGVEGRRNVPLPPWFLEHKRRLVGIGLRTFVSKLMSLSFAAKSPWFVSDCLLQLLLCIWISFSRNNRSELGRMPHLIFLFFLALSPALVSLSPSLLRSRSLSSLSLSFSLSLSLSLSLSHTDTQRHIHTLSF